MIRVVGDVSSFILIAVYTTEQFSVVTRGHILRFGLVRDVHLSMYDIQFYI